MKQVATKGRRLLRKILTVLSLGAVAVTFQACYGMAEMEPDSPPVSLSGKVKSADAQEPIPGISVSIYGYYPSYTDSNGNFGFFVEDFTHTVLFQDVDGPANGEFHDKIVTWKSEDGPLNVELSRK
jgi:hypothetical protein